MDCVDICYYSISCWIVGDVDFYPLRSDEMPRESRLGIAGHGIKLQVGYQEHSLFLPCLWESGKILILLILFYASNIVGSMHLQCLVLYIA